MSAPIAVDFRRCPDHPDAELVAIPNCYSGGIVCTGVVVGSNGDTWTCAARICGRCSGKGASWMSGLCEDCYRIVASTEREWKRLTAQHYAQRALLRDLVAEAPGIPKDWLIWRLAKFDSDWESVTEERFA